MKTKKISALALYSQINYGAVLQTYALQKYLKDLGYQAQAIDYRPPTCADNRSHFQKLRSRIWQNTLKLILRDYKRINKTEQFKKKYISYSAVYYEKNTLAREIEQCDVSIAGSDQVWNPRYAGKDDTWFLSFAKGRKIAYGASFGIPCLPTEYRGVYQKYLQNLDAVSVREETAQKIISRISNKPAEVVLDPVFLIDIAVWKGIAVPPKIKGYILCHYMQGFPKVERKIAALARHYSKKLGLKIVNIGKREYARLFFWQNNLGGAGPAEFVGLIENADIVITNSFHGTAFSVIFGKKVFSVIDAATGEKDLSSRMVDLLKRLEGDACIVDVKTKEAPPPENSGKINKQKLKAETEKSKNFLLREIEA